MDEYDCERIFVGDSELWLRRAPLRRRVGVDEALDEWSRESSV